MCLGQTWTADVAAAGHYVYLDWHLTGAQAPALTDLAPFEARAFAIALLQAAEVAEDGKG